jgi:hypothetical protein
MNIWNQVINTALLGTDKKQISHDELPAHLAGIEEIMAANLQQDNEEKFLNLAAVILNYRQCGRASFKTQAMAQPVAEPELKSYASLKAIQILRDIMEEENNVPLLQFWLKHCIAAEQLITPDMIPALMNIAEQQKFLREQIQKVSGKRGEWLSRLNPSWNFSISPDQTGVWETGNPEERKYFIKQLRLTDPEQARTLMMQVWDKENANAKIEFIKLLRENVNPDDLEWLESLMTEKSSKLRDEITGLLKRIPGSGIIELYWETLRKMVFLKKEKSLLGMMNKTFLQIELPSTFEEAVIKTGIEKLSNNKLFSDEEFYVFQLMNYIPPFYWEKYFETSPENIIQYFQKDKSTQKYLQAFVKAVIRYKDLSWAIAFMQHSEIFYIDLIPLLPNRQKEFYCLKYFDQFPDGIIEYAGLFENSWSTELSNAIFSHASKNPYQYNKSFFNKNIDRLPIHMNESIQYIKPAEEHLHNQWIKTSAHIQKLHTIQQQILKAFND